MSMIHIRHTFSALLFLTAAASMMSCSDKLFEENNTPVDNKDISFTVQTNESSELTNVTPETRAAIAVQTGERPYLLSLKDGEQEIPLRASTVRYMEMDQRRGTVDIDAANVEGGTRTTPKTTATFYSDFGVSAYRYASTWAETLTPNHMYNVQMTNSSGIYRNDANSNFWPASGKLRFFAYAPYADATYLKMSSSSTTAGFPTLSYTVPTTVTDQKDVMVADQEVTCSGTHAAQALAFDHALTAVNFAVGNLKKGTIKKITISGVYGAGTYSYKTKAWTTTGSANASYSVSPNYTTANRSLASNVFITSGDNTLLMIPQTLPTSATVSIEFLFDGEASTRTLTAKLSSDGKAVWAKGTTVTYTVSTTSINDVLIITPPDFFTYEGGTKQYKITSYRWTGDGGQEALKWDASFYNAAGSKVSQPSWVTGFTSTATKIDGSYNAMVSKTTSTNTTHFALLKNEPQKGSSSSYYDLSTHNYEGQTTSRNTANTYIVNARGYYKIPLVYGNAITNGVTNTSSFTSTATSTSSIPVLTRFLDYKGQGITNPYIASKYTPSRCRMIWQDVENMVSNVRLVKESDGQYYAYFEIGLNKNSSGDPYIGEGNALIGALDASGTIMWSWQIWVTDDRVSRYKTLVNHEGNKYKIMPTYLGWAAYEENVKYYPERNIYVKINQSGGQTLSSSFEIVQTGYSYNEQSNIGYAPYYQFGRKDPIVGARTDNGTAKSLYFEDNNAKAAYTFTSFARRGTVSEGIQYPYARFQANGDWSDTHYFNLWSANNASGAATDNPVVKTVYDPSPIGFHVARPKCCTGFTITGEEVDGWDKVNSYGQFNNGVSFYCDPNNKSADNTIFFPACGHRNGSEAGLPISGAGSNFWSWSAIPWSADGGIWTVGFYQSANVRPGYTSDPDGRSDAFPLRVEME
jgi:hypothetical protein